MLVPDFSNKGFTIGVVHIVDFGVLDKEFFMPFELQVIFFDVADHVNHASAAAEAAPCGYRRAANRSSSPTFVPTRICIASFLK